MDAEKLITGVGSLCCISIIALASSAPGIAVASWLYHRRGRAST